MNAIRRAIYTLTEAQCDAGEISEFLGLSIAEVKRVMVVARSAIASKARYHAKKLRVGTR